jgi:ATP-binding cassette subfamily B (MDR/TAP) protein 1
MCLVCRIAFTTSKKANIITQRILSYGTALDKLFMGLAVLCAGGAGVALPLMNIIFGNLVTDFNSYFVPGSGTTEAQFKASVSKNSLLFVYLWIGKFVLAYISMFCFRMTGIRVSAALRLAYLRALFHQPVPMLDKLPSGQTADLITTAANTIQTGISDKLAILVQSLALVIAAYAVAFSRSWQLTLVSSAIMLFIGLVYGMIVPPWLKLENSLNHVNSKASTLAGEVFGSIRTVLSLGAEDAMRAKYRSWIGEARKRGLKMSPLLGLQLAPAYFAILANFSLSFWYGVKMFSRGQLEDIGTLVT